MKKTLLLLLFLSGVAHAALPNCCSRLQLPGWWADAEYLLVWRKERYYPAIITTSPTGIVQAEAGVLGFPTTFILFGDGHEGNSPQSGGRFDAGFWLTPCLGFGASWVALGKEHINYSIDGNAGGVPILAIPYINAGTEDAELISYPGVATNGEIDFNATNNVWVADLYTRWSGWDYRCLTVDLVGGFRYARISDSFDLTTSYLDGGLNTSHESFRADNDFYSGLVGVIGEYRTGCFSVQVNGKFGIGNMVRQVDIAGQGGVFVDDTNRGHHSDNTFEIVSEANAHVAYNVWRNLSLTVGYQWMFWPKVFLVGDQIDRRSGGIHPRFPGRNSHFWTQSLTTGIYFLY